MMNSNEQNQQCRRGAINRVPTEKDITGFGC